MRKCIQLAANGAESKLYDTLLNMTNNNMSKATALYSFFSRPAFIESFGTYDSILRTEGPESTRIDSNGEPVLFLDERTNRYYYVDKKGNRVTFPTNKSSLKNNLPIKDIKETAQYLGMEYLATIRNVNLSEFNLEESIEDTSLKEFIIRKYNERIEELSQMDDADSDLALMYLEDTLPAIDEWVQHIKNFYSSMGLNYDESSEQQSLEEEDTRDSNFGTQSFELDASRNIRTITKLKLATLKEPTGSNIMFGKGAKYVAYSEIKALVEKELNDNYAYVNHNGELVDIADVIIDKLLRLSTKRPELYPIVEEMKRNPDFKTSMVVSFKNQQNNIIVHSIAEVGTDANTGLKTYTTNQKNLSASTTYAKGLIQNWATDYYYHLFGKDHANKDYNKAVASVKDTVEKIKKIRLAISKINSEVFASKYNSMINSLHEILVEDMGITVDKRALFDLFNENDENIEDKKHALVLVSGFETDLNDLLKTKSLEIASNIRTTNYNLIGGSTFLRKLGDKQAIYNDAQSGNTVHAGGKSLHIMSNINYLKNRIEAWKKDPKLLEDYYNEADDYVKSSFFINYLLAKDLENTLLERGLSRVDVDNHVNIERKNRLSKLDIGILTDVYITKENGTLATQSTTVQELSTGDYILNDFLATIDGGFFRTTTAGDKKSNFLINMGNLAIRSFSGYNTQNGTISTSTEVKSIFANYFVSELKRIRKANEQIDSLIEKVNNGEDVDLSTLHIYYHYSKPEHLRVTRDDNGKITKLEVDKTGNAFKSQLFPELSSDSVLSDYLKNESDVARLDLVQKIKNIIYDDNGNINDTLVVDALVKPEGTKVAVDNNADITSSVNSLLFEYIGIVLSDGAIRSSAKLSRLGIFEYDNRGKVKNIKIDNSTLKKIAENYRKKIGFELSMEDLATALATDYYIKSTINNIEYSKLFSGDFAYYKNMVDYKKRVPATYTDGLTMYINDINDVNFNAAVIDSVEITVPTYNSLVNTVGEAVASLYKDTNAADAQAWITPQRWRFITKKLGKWTPTHDSLYEKMMSEEVVQYTNEELKIAAQPLKGVYFGINKKGAPAYLKYSQAVLSPNIVKGTELQAVYDKMTKDADGNLLDYNDQLHELITLDGIKAGSPVTTTIHNEDGSIDVSKLNFNTFKLSNLDWKLQQDLPTKLFKSTEVGSQIQKNIFAALKHNPDMLFEYDGVMKKGSEIMQIITDEVQALSDMGLNKLLKKFDVDSTTNKIKNVDLYYESLIEELRKRGGANNVIDALEKRMTIAGIPQARTRLNNVFASMVNKHIVKIRTNGGSFIQMSNFGIRYSEATAKDSGIILHPEFMRMSGNTGTPFEPRLYTDEETGRERVAPAGIFISGSFIAKYIPDYKKYTSEELFGTYENGKLVKKGVIDNRILENLIGYRIPNQGLPSNDALQIVGILPEENGDTIVAYTGITTKTGSDFDIDKMYVMMPSYYKKFSRRTIFTFSNLLLDRIKGDTINETIRNFNTIYSQMTNNEYEIDDKTIEELLTTQDDGTKLEVSERLNILRKIREDIVNHLFSYENIDSELTRDLERQLGYQVNRDDFYLKYADKKNEPGYHENRLIAAYKSVLTNPEVIKDVMVPIDFTYMKTDIIDITKSHADKDNGPLYHMDPFNDIQLMFDFRNGKAGVGQEANWMVDISRLGNLRLENFITKWFSRYGEDTKSHVLDNEYSRDLTKKDLEEYIEDLSNSLKEDGVKQSDIDKIIKRMKSEIVNIKTSSSMTTILNAFVDIAKDPFITRGNWVTTTTNVGNFLLRLGIHPLYIHAFMAQPILRRYAEQTKTMFTKTGFTKTDMFIIDIRGEYLDNNKSELGLNYLSDLNIRDYYLNNALPSGYIKTVNPDYALTYVSGHLTADSILKYAKVSRSNPQYAEYHKEAIMLSEKLSQYNANDYHLHNKPEFNPELLSLRELRNEAKKVTTDNVELQIGVLLKFNEYQEATRLLTDAMKVGKIDTDGIGDNVSNIIYLNNLVYNLTTKPADPKKPYLSGFESRLINTPLAVYRNNLNKLVDVVKANEDLFFNMKHQSVAMINEVSNALSGKPIADVDLIRAIESGIYQQMMHSFFDMSAIEKESLIANIPETIHSMVSKYPDNSLLSNLVVKPVEVGDNKTLNMVVLPNTKRDGHQQDVLTEGWSELLQKEPKFAEDLIKYSFITTGFNMVSGQFFSLIPHEYFINRDINRFVNNYIIPDSFVKQFVYNNSHLSEVKRNMTRFIGKPSYGNNQESLFYKPAEGETVGHFTVYNGDYYELYGINNEGFYMYLRYNQTYNQIGVNKVADYGDTLYDLNAKRAGGNNLKDISEHRDSNLNVVKPVDLVIDQSYNDPFGMSTVFRPRPLVPGVTYLANDTLSKYKAIDHDKKRINLSEHTSNDKPIFKNIFSGLKQKGTIFVNTNNLTDSYIKRATDNIQDPLLLINNMEYATLAYYNWLVRNDNSLIPSDKLEQYNNLRKLIHRSILDPTSELNIGLDNNYKIISANTQVAGINYKSHVDVLVDLINSVRYQRANNQPVTTFEQNAGLLQNNEVPVKPQQINNVRTTDSQNETLKISNELGTEWRTLPVYSERGVNTMRTENKEFEFAHFGNPWSENGYRGTIKVASVQEAWQNYKDWLLRESNNEQEAEITDERELGELNKGRKVTVKYDRYKNSFTATVIGSELVSESIVTNTTTGEVKSKDQIFNIKLQTNTGKIITANQFEIEGLIKSKTTEVNPQQKAWILEQINSGKLDNATLLYSKKLASRGLGSHAEALMEVVKELRTSTSPIVDIYGNQYSSDTNITTYQSEVGPIRYVTNNEGNLSMLRENTAVSNNQPVQQQNQQYLDNKLLEIGIDNTGNKPKIINSQITPQQKPKGLELLDNLIDKVTDDKKRRELINYKQEVLESQNGLFPISDKEVEEYINKCL